MKIHSIWVITHYNPHTHLRPQSTPVGTTIFRNIHAVDKDAGVNGLVEYFVVEGGHNNATTVDDKLTSADGYGTFAIAFPHQGQVIVIRKHGINDIF